MERNKVLSLFTTNYLLNCAHDCGFALFGLSFLLEIGFFVSRPFLLFNTEQVGRCQILSEHFQQSMYCSHVIVTFSDENERNLNMKLL